MVVAYKSAVIDVLWGGCFVILTGHEPHELRSLEVEVNLGSKLKATLLQVIFICLQIIATFVQEGKT